MLKPSWLVKSQKWDWLVDLSGTPGWSTVNKTGSRACSFPIFNNLPWDSSKFTDTCQGSIRMIMMIKSESQVYWSLIVIICDDNTHYLFKLWYYMANILLLYYMANTILLYYMAYMAKTHVMIKHTLKNKKNWWWWWWWWLWWWRRWQRTA